jgi:hypothetical protein
LRSLFEQASVYIVKHVLPFSAYLQKWQQNWEKVAGWADENITKYPRAVAVTWQTSVNMLPQQRAVFRSGLLGLRPSRRPKETQNCRQSVDEFGS